MKTFLALALVALASLMVFAHDENDFGPRVVPSYEKETAGLTDKTEIMSSFCIKSRDLVANDIKTKPSATATNLYKLIFVDLQDQNLYQFVKDLKGACDQIKAYNERIEDEFYYIRAWTINDGANVDSITYSKMNCFTSKRIRALSRACGFINIFKGPSLLQRVHESMNSEAE